MSWGLSPSAMEACLLLALQAKRHVNAAELFRVGHR